MKLNFFTIDLRFVQRNKETGCIQCSFWGGINGGLENAVAQTVPKIQAKDMKLNFFTITVGKSLEEQII